MYDDIIQELKRVVKDEYGNGNHPVSPEMNKAITEFLERVQTVGTQCLATLDGGQDSALRVALVGAEFFYTIATDCPFPTLRQRLREQANACKSYGRDIVMISNVLGSTC